MRPPGQPGFPRGKPYGLDAVVCTDIHSTSPTANLTASHLKQLFLGLDCVNQSRTSAGDVMPVLQEKHFKKPRAPIKWYMVGMPREHVSLDLMSPINTLEQGNRCILVISDHFTKWKEGLALPDITAVPRALVEWVCRYGPPRFLHSDQGRQFEAEVFQEMCRLISLTETYTSALHLEGNGQVKCYNCTLGAMLAIYTENHHHWDEHLPYIMAAY